MTAPPLSSASPTSPLCTSSSRTTQIIATAVTAAAALGAGILLLVVSRGSAGGGGGSRRAFRSESSIQEPRQAVVEALEAIRGGRCTTCGELVFFLRGPPSSPMPPAARLGFLGSASGTTTEKLPASNAHSLRIPVSVLHYIQESYLPSARRKLVEVQQQQQLSSSTPALQVEYNLFAQMVAADVSLRTLNVERATAFDKDNSSHVNLLQQLWMATGKSAATYSSLGPQWGSIGFQDVDPVTDLRGGGVLALRQLVHFAQVHNAAFREMLTYNERVQREGKHSWYLLAVVSIQLTTQLLLEQNYPLHVAHLEMLYDALRLGAGDATAKTVSRRAVAAQKGVSLDRTSAADTAAFWDSCKSSCSAEAGMFALHHALLLHFKDCWARDEPHVMEYNAYMSAKVYSTFFTTKWADTTLTVL